MSNCYSKINILISISFSSKYWSIIFYGSQWSECSPSHFEISISYSVSPRDIFVPLSVSMSMQYAPLYSSPYYFEQSINVNSLEIICKIEFETGILVA